MVSCIFGYILGTCIKEVSHMQEPGYILGP